MSTFIRATKKKTFPIPASSRAQIDLALAICFPVTQSRRLIDTQDQLKEFLPALRKTDWIGLDTEADSLHSYPEELCLLQISLPGTDVLIDPLASLEVAPLFKALKGKELLMHGSDNDLRLMFAAARFVPTTIFDTMWAARLLGFTAFGLNDLLSKLLGITLDKGSQKANWTRRPLTEKMLNYALNDSRHLRSLADRLRDDLQAKGRLAWHEQICERLIQEHASDRELDLDQAWRLKGSSKLNRRSLAILREVWHWREREAVEANKPPYFIVRHEDLVALAENRHLAGRKNYMAAQAVQPPLQLSPGGRRQGAGTGRRSIPTHRGLFVGESMPVKNGSTNHSKCCATSRLRN